MVGSLIFLSACEERGGGRLWSREARCAAAFLSAVGASKRQTVVTGGVVRTLAVEAISSDMPTVVECPARSKAGQASRGGTIDVGSSIHEIVGCLLFLSACEARDGG